MSGAGPTSEASAILPWSSSLLEIPNSSLALRTLAFETIKMGRRGIAQLSGGDREAFRPPKKDDSRPSLDPAFKRVMTFLFLGTRGGSNRIRIVRLLKHEALNANKIGERLGLDYKTIQHHLQMLEEHNIVVLSSPKGTYGAMYFLSQYFEKQLDLLEEMWVEFGRK